MFVYDCDKLSQCFLLKHQNVRALFLDEALLDVMVDDCEILSVEKVKHGKNLQIYCPKALVCVDVNIKTRHAIARQKKHVHKQ